MSSNSKSGQDSGHEGTADSQTESSSSLGQAQQAQQAPPPPAEEKEKVPKPDSCPVPTHPCKECNLFIKQATAMPQEIARKSDQPPKTGEFGSTGFIFDPPLTDKEIEEALKFIERGPCKSPEPPITDEEYEAAMRSIGLM